MATRLLHLTKGIPMFSQKLKKSLAAMVMLGGALLGAADPAQAIVVSGRWDPLFGSAFPNLGWEGTAEWFVPDACVPQATTVTLLNSASCSAGGMKMLGANVNFYDYAADPTGLTSLKSSLTFGTQSIVKNVTISGSTVSNVNTNLSSAGTLAGPATAFAHVNDFNWALKFVNGQARLYYARIDDGVDDEWEYEREDHDYDDYDACMLGSTPRSTKDCGVNDFRSYPAVVTFTTQSVPEPQTLSLMLAGLAAIGFIGRRQRRPAKA